MTRSSRDRGLLRRTAAALGLALLLCSCGESTARDATDTTGPRSTDYLITSESLPTGWGDSNSQGVDYRVDVCGVDLEPEPPVRATSVRFSEGPLGPFLEEHVRVYDSDLVSGVIDQLRAALADCTGYTASGSRPDSPEARFIVKPLSVDGAPEDSVAWRQTSQGRIPITADLLLIRRGDAAVMLMSYAIRAVPDPAVLAAAAAAVPEGE
ncbi:hypothetical protein [Nocardioides sp. T2.26MG-1]|uniref:hypothetical protein n=1 Tax=Nocardioides sp. T2.26MG-1 TaxID=3041166 RepID=UPI002477BF06|nr:hypothetical protein [Nocardioides sp. T2.26MG-1]CAI9415439.1 hypothetical protein HIDPHFAB_02521 [Nocardioides sp. T2.26MG-1]